MVLRELWEVMQVTQEWSITLWVLRGQGGNRGGVRY